MKNIILTLMLAATAAAPCAAQQTKVLSAEKHNEYGLVYSLPLTALEITITAEKETLIAGPYSNFAKKYLAADKVISESGEKWTIKNISVRPYGAINPDENSQYLMQLKPGSTTFIGVDRDGMLLSINREPQVPVPAEPYSPVPDDKPLTGKEYLKYVNEDFIASQSSAKQAQMLSENIMEIRDAYISLTRGTADNMPTDGRQLELMLNSLQAQEKALTAAFTGCSYTESVCRTYTFLPEDDEESVLLRFSDFKGFCAPTDYAGAPVTMRVAVTARGTLPADANGVEKQLPKDAVRYCIPGNARISILFDGQTLYNKEMEFAQMGIQFGLDPKLFTDKKNPSYAIFDPVTGGLLDLGALPRQ